LALDLKKLEMKGREAMGKMKQKEVAKLLGEDKRKKSKEVAFCFPAGTRGV